MWVGIVVVVRYIGKYFVGVDVRFLVKIHLYQFY